MSIKVVFVCLGNICRSPMAEAIFQKLVDDAGLSAQISVDSVGTGAWHIGEKAHQGTRRILSQHDIAYNGRARMVEASDITPATYVIGMDQSNLDNLTRQFGSHPRSYRLLDFAQNSEIKDVPDPYYTSNFEYVYQLVSGGCHGLLATIRQQEGL